MDFLIICFSYFLVIKVSLSNLWSLGPAFFAFFNEGHSGGGFSIHFPQLCKYYSQGLQDVLCQLLQCPGMKCHKVLLIWLHSDPWQTLWLSLPFPHFFSCPFPYSNNPYANLALSPVPVNYHPAFNMSTPFTTDTKSYKVYQKKNCLRSIINRLHHGICAQRGSDECCMFKSLKNNLHLKMLHLWILL